MAAEREEKEEIKIEKPDVSRLLAAIPPASALKARQKKVTEKRIRLRYDDTLEPEEAKIHPNLARELNIGDLLEITVAGRHRFVFKAIKDEEIEENVVHVNPDLMEEHGIADNSIATVRAYRGSERLGVNLGPRK
jgi:hypothetical protein